jgi:hypothetical protein
MNSATTARGPSGMIRSSFPRWSLGCLVLGFAHAAAAAESGSFFSAEALKDASRLVAEMPQVIPVDNAEATLHIKRGRERWDVPVACAVTHEGETVRTSFSVTLSSRNPAEKLVIVQEAGGAVSYLFGTSEDGRPPVVAPVSGGALDQNLGGSDFTLGSLGLDFLRWPKQTLLKSEMRIGQPCVVLESARPAATNGMVRLKSWIDRESGAILVAEGYDADGKMIREFSLSGSSMVKVDGRYQLKQMSIRTPGKSNTVLEFDLDRR